MAIFNSYVSHYQRVSQTISDTTPSTWVLQTSSVQTTIAPVHHALPTVQQEKLLRHSEIRAVFQAQLVVTSGILRVEQHVGFLAWEQHSEVS